VRFSRFGSCTGGRFDRGVCARAAPTSVEIPGRAGRRPAIRRILLGKNMESKLPIASLTKLMTAIVTLTPSSTRRSRDDHQADVDSCAARTPACRSAPRSRATSCCTSPHGSENRAASAIASSYPAGKTRACWR